ncbi:MAG: hypothetical protein GY732_18615 [Gammaproteobacteria bacterium]|nr:hypothetical protein [Gammaproteobacteria bacterium]
MEWRTACLSIVVFTLMGMVSSVMAHRAPGSLTTIKWNEASGRTEIIHQLHIHDAESGVGTSLNMTGLSVEDAEGRAHIAIYVEEHFYIKMGEKKLQLELIGAELSGNFILIYQEFPDRLTQNILIHNSILRDMFPTQTNQVNIEDGDKVYSLIFSKDVGWLSYEFSFPSRSTQSG